MSLEHNLSRMVPIKKKERKISKTRIELRKKHTTFFSEDFYIQFRYWDLFLFLELYEFREFRWSANSNFNLFGMKPKLLFFQSLTGKFVDPSDELIKESNF